MDTSQGLFDRWILSRFNYIPYYFNHECTQQIRQLQTDLYSVFVSGICCAADETDMNRVSVAEASMTIRT